MSNFCAQLSYEEDVWGYGPIDLGYDEEEVCFHRKERKEDTLRLGRQGLTLSELEWKINNFCSMLRLRVLYLDNNQLTELPPIPATLQELSVSGNYLKKIQKLPSGLTNLNLSNNFLEELPFTLPEELETLQISTNLLTTLPLLPDDLRYLDVSENNLTEITSIPSSLKNFKGCKNKFTRLPVFPETITEITVPNNQLRHLPAFENGQHKQIYLGVNGNCLQNLPSFPGNVLISFSENPLLEETLGHPKSAYLALTAKWNRTIARNNILVQFRFLFYLYKFRPKLRDWLWRLRERKAIADCHPNKLEAALCSTHPEKRQRTAEELEILCDTVFGA